jgi:hypothetical protein
MSSPAAAQRRFASAKEIHKWQGCQLAPYGLDQGWIWTFDQPLESTAVSGTTKDWCQLALLLSVCGLEFNSP